MKRLQAGDIDYKEASAASAIRNKFEVDGIKAEQNAAVLKVGSLCMVQGALATPNPWNLQNLCQNLN